MSKLVGQRFGNLVVLRQSESHKLVCRCDCGHELVVWDAVLKRGRTDCGCVRFKEGDLTGKKFGRWTVMGPAKENRIQKWICRCDCGTERTVGGNTLSTGASSSCGCLQRDVAAEQCKETVKDLVGQRFGRLIVLSREGSRLRKAMWRCRCDCEKETVVWSRSLIAGSTQSCGCFRKEQAYIRRFDTSITDEERELRENRRMDSRTILWRNAVYARDNFVCMACGKTSGGDLIAHHKNSWNRHKDIRFDVANGVTCCGKCHKQFHEAFGYGDNTEDEWKMFLRHRGVEGVSFQRPPPKRRIKVDLTGKRFRKLTVLEFDLSSRAPRWICRCDCGTVKSIGEHPLKRGCVGSCGCLRRIKIDLTGRRFKKLTVLRFDLSNRVPHWICRCDCGTEKSIREHHLKTCFVGSCGCLRREQAIKMGKKNFKDLTGMTSGKLTVVGRDKRDNSWICRCICGNLVSRHRSSILERTFHRCKCGVA